MADRAGILSTVLSGAGSGGLISTMADLKDYVSAAPQRNLAAGMVTLQITHNLIAANFQEIPFALDSTLLRVKEKIHGLCGSIIDAMDLTLDGTVISFDGSNHDVMFGAVCSSFCSSSSLLTFASFTAVLRFSRPL